MTNEQLESYIDSLNQNQITDYIFRTMLTKEVDLAKVWTELPNGNISNQGSYDIYFIKNFNNTYVAAVLDMHHDLHVFVKAEHRKKGYLSKAINEVILPHLACNGRDKQKITFEDKKMGNYFMKNWGFTIIDEHNAERSLAELTANNEIINDCYQISYSDYQRMQAKIRTARLHITMVKEQLEATFGKLDDSNIAYLEYELQKLEDDVFNLIEERQGNLY
ncbi:hypothetical protein GBN24_16760 [Plesiomonas shigelloides]|uniref:hypothetical protein n=1 Tax=Plesiomonas shigelloides TaxID=703 RepID=UPI0012623F06|nr:hypothetical protein [Plesiomonas shigelloides]KAB7685803.1 hypothetical protein GBN24_16760 [Plesiomonas shigelloides]